jgi:FtsP/CotA-like multicopper oxidase with cupredoxin domain
MKLVAFVVRSLDRWRKLLEICRNDPRTKVEADPGRIHSTIGKPGVQVASITKRPVGYVFAHVEGAARPTVNGKPLVTETLQLKDGDVIELAGTQMQFINR